MNDSNLEPGHKAAQQLQRRLALMWVQMSVKMSVQMLALIPALVPAQASGQQAPQLAVAPAAQPLARPSPKSVPAAQRRVEPFDTATWSALQAGVHKPAAVVFTTTDCAHCPAVIAQLAAQVRQAPPRARPDLITVVMDQAPGDDDAALLADPHFSASPRLMAFAGQGPALRHAVDPAWRGVTPYVVLLAPGKLPRAVTGPPSSADLAQWMAR